MADEDLFLSRMRALGVEPLDQSRRRPAAEPAELEPLFDLEVEDSESDLFLRAMGDLGLAGAPARKEASDPVPSDSVPAAPPNETHDAPAADRSPRPGPEPRSQPPTPDVDPADLHLFLSAIETIDEAPAKELPVPEESPRTVRRLKAPRSISLEPDEVLDLHRLRVGEALARLESFIRQAMRDRSSLALVITGKGHHSKDGIPVLKNSVEEWIRREGADRIRAYSEAAPAQGGRGAFLLHLRRP